jgi:hypothetical protein
MNVCDEAHERMEARVTRKEDHMPMSRHKMRGKRRHKRGRTARRGR